MASLSPRYQWEVVELTHDCPLGYWKERAVVVDANMTTITLVFPNRAANDHRMVTTSTDSPWLRKV